MFFNCMVEDELQELPVPKALTQGLGLLNTGFKNRVPKHVAEDLCGIGAELITLPSSLLPLSKLKTLTDQILHPKF